MNWDFNNNNNENFIFQKNKNKDNEKEKYRSIDLLLLPREWIEIFLNESFILNIFNTYNNLRKIYLHFFISSSTKNQNKNNVFTNNSKENDLLTEIERTLDNLKLLLISFSSISGPFFSNENEKIHMCNILIKPILISLNTSLQMSIVGDNDDSNNNNNCENQIENLRSTEMIQFSTVILRLLGNYHMKLLSKIDHLLFEQFLTVIGESILKLSQELNILSNEKLKKLLNNTKPSIDMNWESLLTTWKSECLDVLLDAWSMIIEKQEIFNTIDNNMNNNGNIKIMISNIGGKSFQQLYELMIKNTIYESIEYIDADDDIDYESDYNLLQSICVMGRTNFYVSLFHIYR